MTTGFLAKAKEHTGSNPEYCAICAFTANFVLGTLYSAGKGVTADPDAAFRLFQKSCETGWGRGCGRLGLSYEYGQGTPVDHLKALENFDRGCDEHNAASCYQSAQMYWDGSAGPREKRTSMDRLRQACELGLDIACKQRQKLSAAQVIGRKPKDNSENSGTERSYPLPV